MSGIIEEVEALVIMGIKEAGTLIKEEIEVLKPEVLAKAKRLKSDAEIKLAALQHKELIDKIGHGLLIDKIEVAGEQVWVGILDAVISALESPVAIS